jgi:trehalose-phosphatase
MKTLRAGVDADGFFAQLPRAPARVLLLDYDGTLAPFQIEREKATPYPLVREAVRDILTDGCTRVVVVSGRTVGDLAPLLGLDPLPELWGTHGWERLRPDGSHEPARLGGATRASLERGAELARASAPAERVEVKPASVAVHVRGLEAREGARLLERVRAAWEPLVQGGALEAHDFDGGAELRVRGRDKGTAVAEVLAEEPAAAAIAYLGDDLTDEDAFKALGARGMSVLVREEPRETAADVWIRPPEELLEFLRRWRAQAARAGPPAGELS